MFFSGPGKLAGWVSVRWFDSSEIINTLRGGGITSVGYAISEVMSKRTKDKKGIFGGLKDKFGPKKEANEEVLLGEDRSAKIAALVRRAMLGRVDPALRLFNRRTCAGSPCRTSR